MRFLSVLVLLFHFQCLTANYTFEPDKLRSPPAPFYSFKCIDRISITADIARGINFQANLMNGKVPIEDVIGEILNVSSSDISDFKSNEIAELPGSLKTISLGRSAEVMKLESESVKFDTFIGERLRKTFEDISKLPGREEYFVEAQKIIKSNFTEFATFKEGLEMIEEDLQVLSKAFSDTYEETRKIYTALLSIYDMNLFRQNEPLIEMFNSLKNLKNGISIFKRLREMPKFIKLRKEFLSYNEQEKFSTINYLKQVLNLDELHKASDKNIQRLLKLTSNTKELSTDNLTVKNIGDPWLGRIFKVKRAELNDLANSFEPLPTALKLLTNFNSELLSIDESSQTYEGFEQLKDTLSSVPKDIGNVTDFLEEIEKCNGVPIDEMFEQEIDAFLQDVDLVEQLFNSFTEIFSLEKAIAEYKSRVNSWKLTENYWKSVAILDNFRDSGLMDRLGNKTNESLEQLSEIEAVGYPVFRKLKVEGDRVQKKILAELSVYNCLQHLKQDSELFQLMLAVGEQLSNLDKEIAENIQEVSSIATKLSQDLATVKSIPEKMKENSNDKTLALNSLSFDQSEAIGITTSSLRNVYNLLELETSINQLKNVDSIVLEEIEKSQDPTKLKPQWGNHTFDMENLDATINEAKALVAKLEAWRAKTLVEFTDPLKNLSKIPDIKLNASEKSKVLEELIQLNDNSDLIAAKETLDKIAAMDLQFSSAQYQHAAFKDLQDGLLTFWNRKPV